MTIPKRQFVSGGHDIILEEHLKNQSILDGELQGVSEVRTETDFYETKLDSQQFQHKTTFKSDPDQVSAPEFNVNNEGSYQKQETAASRADAETETSLLCQDIQNLSKLKYDQLDNSTEVPFRKVLSIVHCLIIYYLKRQMQNYSIFYILVMVRCWKKQMSLTLSIWKIQM